MTLFFIGQGRDACGLFNIGFGSVRSWNDLAKAAFTAFGKEPKIDYIEMPETLKGRYQYYTCLDISKLRKAGYTKDLTTLEEAAKDYYAYFIRNGHLGD